MKRLASNSIHVVGVERNG